MDLNDPSKISIDNLREIVGHAGLAPELEPELPVETHQIVDSTGKQYLLSFARGGDAWVVRLFDKEVQVGQANCGCHGGESLFLGDIVIFEGVALPFQWWRRFLGCKRRVANYQHRGLGSALLRFIIDQARRRGFQQITGNLFPQSLETRSWLPDWYTKNGFQVRMTTATPGSIVMALRPPTETVEQPT